MKIIPLVAAGIAVLTGGTAPAQAQFVWPTAGVIGSSYWTDRGSFYHKAIDINGSYGTKVVASYAGKILLRGRYSACEYYGNLVAVRHGGGYDTYYAHNSRFASGYVGQSVGQNQIIAYMGQTGNAASVHVHFEVRRWNARIYSYACQIYVPGYRGMRVYAGQKINYSFPGLTGGTTTSSLQARKVTSTDLNVRSGPGTGYSILGQAHQGQIYIRTAVSGDWSKIWFDGRTGWVSSAYTVSAAGAAARKVTASLANVRTGPSTAYAIIASAHQGEIYGHILTSNGWAKIWFKGRTGWVRGDLVVPVAVD